MHILYDPETDYTNTRFTSTCFDYVHNPTSSQRRRISEQQRRRSLGVARAFRRVRVLRLPPHFLKVLRRELDIRSGDVLLQVLSQPTSAHSYLPCNAA